MFILTRFLIKILVQTGKYRKQDSNASEGLSEFKSVAEAIDHIIDQYK